MALFNCSSTADCLMMVHDMDQNMLQVLNKANVQIISFNGTYLYSLLC
jgi:hypothetical protein